MANISKDDVTSSYPIPQTFQFDNLPVRLTDQDGQVWFIANDVCAILEHTNSRRAIERLDEDEKSEVAIKDSMGRSQTVNIISESGLYALVMTSRKAQAKRFKKWVTAEVLPQIRKTGSYAMQQSEPEAQLEDKARNAHALDLAQELSSQLTKSFLKSLKAKRNGLHHIHFVLHVFYDHNALPVNCTVTCVSGDR